MAQKVIATLKEIDERFPECSVTSISDWPRECGWRLAAKIQ